MEVLCLIFLALALRLLKDNSSITMIYIIKILQITEISTFSESILDKAVEMHQKPMFKKGSIVPALENFMYLGLT